MLTIRWLAYAGCGRGHARRMAGRERESGASHVGDRAEYVARGAYVGLLAAAEESGFAELQRNGPVSA
jgi:hypothetical protein